MILILTVGQSKANLPDTLHTADTQSVAGVYPLSPLKNHIAALQ